MVTMTRKIAEATPIFSGDWPRNVMCEEVPKIVYCDDRVFDKQNREKEKDI